MSMDMDYGPKRLLAHDEVVKILRKKARFGVGDGFATARIRVWQADEWPAVVLVSQVPGGSEPAWDTNLYANYVLSAILRHDPEGMSYFEDHQSGFIRKLSLVGFSEAGCELRKRLYNPQAKEQNWSVIESMVGNEVAH